MTEEIDTVTPLAGLRDSVATSTSEKPLVCLLATGSFNPVHVGHVAMLRAAKAFMEDVGGAEVVGGFISPSHGSYVARKMRSTHGTADWLCPRRDALCDAAVLDLPWLKTCRWEISHEEWQPYIGDVVVRMQELLDTLPAKVHVVYVCGADLFRHGMMFFPMPAIGIARAGHPEVDFPEDITENVNKPFDASKPGEALKWYHSDAALPEVSSTAIRDRLLAGAGVADLTGAAVEAVLMSTAPEWAEWRAGLGLIA